MQQTEKMTFSRKGDCTLTKHTVLDIFRKRFRDSALPYTAVAVIFLDVFIFDILKWSLTLTRQSFALACSFVLATYKSSLWCLHRQDTYTSSLWCITQAGYMYIISMMLTQAGRIHICLFDASHITQAGYMYIISMMHHTWHRQDIYTTSLGCITQCLSSNVSMIFPLK